ncbi:MAG: hypothetical protein HY835_08165 [Anaerolineae bacterium]|nr:hypothetical protein [Anaerolineae bacterium]
MPSLDGLDWLYVTSGYLFQLVLIVHFSMRRWAFARALRWGWIVYALSVPAAAVSLALLLGGKNWSFWLAGFLFLIWAAFGYTVEYVRRIEWRSPIRWPIFGPYLLLYLATCMFYWFPMTLIARPFWYVAGGLFVISTLLNVFSHHPAAS